MFFRSAFGAAAAISLMLAASAGAMAQSSTLKPFPLTGASSVSNTQGVKIAVTYQFFIEGRTQTMADQAALADQGRKHLYLMLAKECVVLKETIAETCAIQRASVNAQLRNRSRSKNNGLRISGSASYSIQLKREQRAEKE
ncbi:MAG: hypothetical protein ACR2PI_13525 [Hyphomicrobiaceae bacterium]